MHKTVVIVLLTLAALGALALGWGWMEVDAGCCCNPRVCASYIKGSGSPVGLVTAPGGAFAPGDPACDVVATSDEGGYGGYGGPLITQLNGPPVVTSVTLRIVGKGPGCSLDPSDSESCDVPVVVDCGGTIDKKATTPGPLTINAPSFGQTNNGSGPDSANFTFQLNAEEKLDLCPNGRTPGFYVPGRFLRVMCQRPVRAGVL